MSSEPHLKLACIGASRLGFWLPSRAGVEFE